MKPVGARPRHRGRRLSASTSPAASVRGGTGCCSCRCRRCRSPYAGSRNACSPLRPGAASAGAARSTTGRAIWRCAPGGTSPIGSRSRAWSGSPQGHRRPRRVRFGGSDASDPRRMRRCEWYGQHRPGRTSSDVRPAFRSRIETTDPIDAFARAVTCEDVSATGFVDLFQSLRGEWCIR
jgi:hypothetical protein